MDRARRIAVLSVSALMAACATTDDRATLAQLHHMKIEIKEAKVDGGIEKAIEGYQRFLAETGQSKLVPEAMRRLADLKVEKEYGIIADPTPATSQESTQVTLSRPPSLAPAAAPPTAAARSPKESVVGIVPGRRDESDQDFEKRATTIGEIKAAPRPGAELAPGADLEKAGPREAIALYKKLLAQYPLYDRKDQVLYHMSRAYAELGEVEAAMAVMNRLVKEEPNSKYFDEVQFRRGEYFFTRKKFLDAEDAYKAVVDHGIGSPFYELALYKLGWAYYKQELYDEALERFVALLDYKASTGFDFEKSTNELEKKRVDDTYRVISLSFSNSGGPKAIADFFEKRGKRPYEVDIYRNLAEFYLDKRRYHDAAATYKAFVQRDPFHKVAPDFDMKVIATYRKGGFPKLVIDATKDFAQRYGLKAAYWTHYDPSARPEVVGYLKQNLRELADYYHARYQDKHYAKDKDANYRDALTWYREYLDSFAHDPDAPGMNYQLADLLLENKSYTAAASEYEKTAYDYGAHAKAAAAGYAAVYARREALKTAPPNERENTKREVIRSSLQFADRFPTHEKAAVVLGAAADDLYEMKDYPRALATARKLIGRYPQADRDVRRAAWLVVGHASLELGKFADAEAGYTTVLQLTDPNDKTRAGVMENLAASIYEQGDQANKRGDYKTAAENFLRIAQAAPTAKIRPTAEYDGATALLKLKEWSRAIEVLQGFRKHYPSHELQPEVTKKIALAHKEAGQLAAAAAEYERVETETKDDEQRRSALELAAELHEQAGETARALGVYRRYVEYFPKPVELAVETRHKIAGLCKALNDTQGYLAELKRIVDTDAHAGAERTDRTRYLAAVSALGLAEPLYDRVVGIKLVKPFKQNLARKQAAMKEATSAFGKLADYHAGEVTAAATFYIAEIYYDFSRALTTSERPTDLSPQEREQYELALEDQAYPFEEKAIAVHEKNLELLGAGVYNTWIDKSIAKLAKLVPARYAKFEESAGFIYAMGPFRYQMVAKSSGEETGSAAAPSSDQAPSKEPPAPTGTEPAK
jgi:tetratricopeptide (TPR) repeat protein